MELQGKIIKIYELKKGETKEGKKWASISFVLETFDQYPQTAMFEMYKTEDYVDYVKNFSHDVGDVVKVDFSFNANYYELKDTYYNKLRVFRVYDSESIDQESSSNSETNDLPF